MSCYEPTAEDIAEVTTVLAGLEAPAVAASTVVAFPDPNPAAERERNLDRNVFAERAIIAAVLSDPSTGNNVLCDLIGMGLDQDTYIQTPICAMVYSAALIIDAAGGNVNRISVFERLRSRSTAGDDTLMERIDSVSVAPANCGDYRQQASIVLKHALRKKIEYAGAQLIQLSYRCRDMEMSEMQQESERIVDEAINAFAGGSHLRPNALGVDSYGQYLRDMLDGNVHSVMTGYTELDRLTGGLEPCRLYALGARPGIGKSAFALNIAINAAKRGTTVAYFSFEMSEIELIARQTCIEMGYCGELFSSTVDDDGNQVPNYTAEDLENWLRDAPRLSELPILITDETVATPAYVCARSKQAMRDIAPGRGLVIVDYLQLMTSGAGAKGAANRQQEVADMSRAMKMLAKQIKQPVLLLCQLNREGSRREDKQPVITDLRESGAIEQDADYVILLDRSLSQAEADSTTDRNPRPPLGVTNVIVAKARNKSTGVVPLMYIAERLKFQSLPSVPSAEDDWRNDPEYQQASMAELVAMAPGHEDRVPSQLVGERVVGDGVMRAYEVPKDQLWR